MMMGIHPLPNLLVEAPIFEIGVKNQPNSPEIRNILRQVPIANNRKEMRQLFRLPHDTLDRAIAQIVLERPIGELRGVDNNVSGAEFPGHFVSSFAEIGFYPRIVRGIVIPQRKSIRRNQSHHHQRTYPALDPILGPSQGAPHQQDQAWRRVNQGSRQEEVLPQRNP
jgi:hypothetical protein